MDRFQIYEVGGRRYRVRTELSGGTSGVGGDNSRGQPASRRNIGPGAKSQRKEVPLARQIHRFIIGHGGSTLRKLYEESHAKITVPNERVKSDSIQIEGLPDEIEKAEQMIEQIVQENIHKVPYTHFISLPISDIDVQRKVKQFQDDVAQEFLRDVDCKTFVDPGSLHITVGMLRLLTNAQVTSAVEYLKSLHTQIYDILGTRSLVVNVGRLRTMEKNPAKARILYTLAEDFEFSDHRLQRLCSFVRESFSQAGYIDERRDLTIHITVIKARAPSQKPTEAGFAEGGHRSAGIINAVPLLKRFDMMSFGTCRLGQVQIAKRFHHTESGAYDSEGCVLLP
ncbi:activating signal cointegrator 1 complex subunit [Coemansia sp. RSA 1722]|nr:activating signal cointegrator 1 complex subunit [Coemansia sp. RSA 1722]